MSKLLTNPAAGMEVRREADLDEKHRAPRTLQDGHQPNPNHMSATDTRDGDHAGGPSVRARRQRI